MPSMQLTDNPFITRYRPTENRHASNTMRINDACATLLLYKIQYESFTADSNHKIGPGMHLNKI